LVEVLNLEINEHTLTL